MTYNYSINDTKIIEIHKKGCHNMAIKGIEDVKKFLQALPELLDSEDTWQINNRPWANGKVNKTMQYMAETGIGTEVIKNVVRELKVKHYSSTEDDYNVNFQHEQVWKFGITKNLVDEEEKLYIKLKIRAFENGDFLLIMSFHPESPKHLTDELKFPYKDYEG